MVAIIFAFAGAAFTVNKSTQAFQKSMEDRFYYSYDLDTDIGKNNPANYTYMSPQPSNPGQIEGCNGFDIPCVIRATGTTTEPNASEVSSSNLDGVTIATKDVLE